LKIVAVIQARLESKRFPRKSLTLYNGKTLVRNVVGQVKQVRSIDEVVAAIPIGDDLVLRDEFLASGVDSIEYGSEVDVLQRVLHAAVLHEATVVVRVTADCPVWSPNAGEGTIQSYVTDKKRRSFWSNDTTMSGWPDGTDVEVFSIELLKEADKAASSPVRFKAYPEIVNEEREHVTTWMKRNTQCGVYKRTPDRWSKTKLSVDTPEDLIKLQALDIPVEW
tara:strand:- start:100 stop:765 length:666 start_codon:yes stop_codon:yes gene_type:complete